MKQLATVFATTAIALNAGQLHAAEPQDLQTALANALDQVNAGFAAAGSARHYLKVEALLAAEAYLSSDAQPVSVVVIAKDVGNKQLIGLNGPEHFVPRDPRRLPWSEEGDTVSQDSITYAYTHFLGGSWLFPFDADQERVIGAAMSAWDAIDCAKLPIVNSNQPVTFLLPLPPGADVEHAGVLSFSSLGIPLQAGVIALTLTAYFEDPPGVLTDVDGNGRADVMSRAILYNGDWLSFVDFPTVARHEVGHGLSQGHFGNVWLDDSGLRAAPRAAMNAAYTGSQPLLSGTDRGGHCSIWASWPHR